MTETHKLNPPRRPKRQPIAHPGGLVRAIIDDRGASISAVARAIKMDRASLSLVLSGEYAVSRTLAYNLGALFGDDVADLLIAAQRAWEDQEGEGMRSSAKASIEPWQGKAAKPAKAG